MVDTALLIQTCVGLLQNLTEDGEVKGDIRSAFQEEQDTGVKGAKELQPASDGEMLTNETVEDGTDDQVTKCMVEVKDSNECGESVEENEVLCPDINNKSNSKMIMLNNYSNDMVPDQTNLSDTMENLEEDDDFSDDGDEVVIVKEEKGSTRRKQQLPLQSAQHQPSAYDSSDSSFTPPSHSLLLSHNVLHSTHLNSPAVTEGEGIAGEGIQCRMCGKRLATLQSLQKHEDRHRGIYPYHCHICGKGFSSRFNMRGHMSAHTNVREYRCQLCAAEYVYKQALQKHMEKVHGILCTTSSITSPGLRLPTLPSHSTTSEQSTPSLFPNT